MLVVSLALSLLTTALFSFVLLNPGRVVSRHPIRCFGVALALICVTYTFVLTPFSPPDENRHYCASYWMSDCFLGMASFTDGEPFPMRESDYEFLLGPDGRGNMYRVENQSYRWVASHAQVFDTSDGTVQCERSFTLASDPPQSRIGSAVGMTLARIVELGPVPTFYMGRLGSVAVFVLLAMWAVKVAPFGQRMLMAICMLPITASLAASYSYDSGIISMSLLSFAYLMRGIYGEGELGARDITPVVTLAILLTPCKVIYSAIFACVLLIPNARFKTRRHAWSFRLGVVGSILLALLVTKLPSVLALLGADGPKETVERLGSVGRMYTFGDLLANPVGSILLYLRSFDTLGGGVWSQTFGSTLGSLQGDIIAPSWVTAAFFVLVLLASARATDDDKKLPARHVALMVSIGTCIMLAAWLSQCLGWTMVGETVIQGMQGRYILPALCLLFVAVRSTPLKWERTGSAVPFVSSATWLNITFALWIIATALTL